MINTKLQSIIDTKSAIGNAIVNKGGTITGETPFFNYAAEIDNISTGSVLTGNATVGEVFNGQTFYSNDANTQLTGTFVFDGNATVANVETGRTFFATNGTKLTGTGTIAAITGVDERIMTLQAISPSYTDFSNVYSLSYNINTVAVNNGFVYATGSQGSGTVAIKRYHANNLAYINQSSEIGIGRAMAINNSNIFVVRSFNTISKFHEGNFTFITNDTAASTVINAATEIVIHNGVVFVATALTGMIKHLESNLAFNGQTYYGTNQPRTIAVTNSFFFVGLSNGAIFRQYFGNSVNIGNISVSGEGPVTAIRTDQTYIYATWITGSIRKYWASNLVLVASNVSNTSSYGPRSRFMPNSLNINGDYLYASGITNNAVDALIKMHKSNLVTVSNAYTDIRKIVIDNGSIYGIPTYNYAEDATARNIFKYSTNTPYITFNGSNFYNGGSGVI
jgi:hypothetical protein